MRVEMALVDNDLANLSLDEEEDEGFQFAVEEGPQQPLYDLCLVGCALTTSVKRINLGLKEVEYGWDVSLRAQPRGRALLQAFGYGKII
ncbi:hypothetical protein Gohar_027156 [Gossypium harknessii]|uniref:Uncharacterized protein n=1 Tax=Gossypium harknessii TaxID=34285 RepID=A0A7J9HUJ0_9ROSI|nr:hypothetical protein [Gossypium harknessii]